MVKYTTTSTGKKAIVGSKHVIDGRTFEVMADGKMKNLGKASASTPAKAAPKAAAKAKPAAKPAAKKVTSPVVPKRRPSSTEMHAARMNKLTGGRTGGGF
jgi:hypothetical protein